MKKILTIFLFIFLLQTPTFAFDFSTFVINYKANADSRSVESFLNSQVRYANRANYNKFISTYADSYVSADGFDKKTYSDMVKDIWESYDRIRYGISIKDININGDKATVKLIETSYAELSMTDVYKGELKSLSDVIYYLQKNEKGRWQVIKDKVLEESTTMLYGSAKGLEVTLTVPTEIAPNTDYIATLEFTPPEGTIAIASLASDIVEYPQKPTKEVFRALPDDNILERFFTSNDGSANEYVVASIGLTKTAVEDLNLKLHLTGFGYAIKRVNLLEVAKKGVLNEQAE